MKYLIIATKDRWGCWNATLTSAYVIGQAYVDMLDNATKDIPTLTTDNFNLVEIRQGKLVADNISDIEPLMRLIGFRKCDICGDWCTPQDVREENSVYTGGKRYCIKCNAVRVATQPKTLRLSGYHSTSGDVRVINAIGENYTLANVLGVGFEAEYYNQIGGDYIKCTDTFYNLANPDNLNAMFRVERDGSVSGEIISNIFTKKSLYDFDFKIITDMLLLNGNIPNNTEAGLHVHLSKLWLGDTPKEQVLNYLKLQYFMKSYENDFLKLCGRNPDAMYYCKFFSHSEIEGMKRAILARGDDAWRYMPCNHGGGGCALNASGATIEFRIGANTHDPVRMRNFILFLLGITEHIKNVPFEKCYCIGKVTRLVPSDVMNYWRKQGCFLNTNAINERGVILNG